MVSTVFERQRRWLAAMARSVERWTSSLVVGNLQLQSTMVVQDEELLGGHVLSALRGLVLSALRRSSISVDVGSTMKTSLKTRDVVVGYPYRNFEVVGSVFKEYVLEVKKGWLSPLSHWPQAWPRCVHCRCVHGGEREFGFQISLGVETRQFWLS